MWLRLAAVLVGVALVACESVIGPPLVVGSGDVRIETRDLAAFTQIAVRSAWDVVIEIGPAHSVRLEADANILEVARTDIDDGLLIVDTPDVRISRPTRMRATVTVPHLNDLRASDGAAIHASALPGQPALAVTAIDTASVEIGRLRTDRLTVTVRGSGEVRVAGVADELALLVSADGAAHLAQLAAERASVDLTDSALAEMQVRRAITGTLTDAAELRLRGSPPDERLSTSDGTTVVHE